MRPYNSLPRGQDINNYPALALHRSKNEDQEANTKNTVASTKCPPTRRAHSEDVYVERQSDTSQTQLVKEIIEKNMESTDEKRREKQPAPRINPLMRLNSENRQENLKTTRVSPRRRVQHAKTELQDAKKLETHNSYGRTREASAERKQSTEKRVSFESSVMSKSQDACLPKNTAISKSATAGEQMAKDAKTCGSEEAEEEETATPVELCDIEPLSGTVFRKVTVRRRRQEMRKLPAVDTGECS